MSYPKMPGTNFFAPELVNGGVKVAFTDENGDAIFVKAATADIPSAKPGYAVGCLLINTTSGVLYYNAGTTASCNFTAV